MTHIFNNIMDGGYFMAFGTLSPIQRRCKEFTEATLQEVLAIRQRERYLNNIKACITGYPPADEEEPFVPENFSQYQFFLPFEEIIDYADRFDFLMCCLAAGVCKVHKGFEERYQQSLLKVLTFRTTTNPTTPLGYILSPELLPIVRYEEDDDEENEVEGGDHNDDDGDAQLLIGGAQAAGDDGTAVTPSRPTTVPSNGAVGGGELIVASGMELAIASTPTSQLQHGGTTTPASSPTRSNQKGRKILTEKEQVLNDADFDTSGLTVQEIDAERARRKALQSSIIDEYISNKDSYVLSLKEELKRLLAEEEEEARNGGGVSNNNKSSTTPAGISDVEGDTINPVTTTSSAMDVIAAPIAPKEEAVSSTATTTNADNGVVSSQNGEAVGSVLELVLKCKADHVAESELAAAPIDNNADEL